MYNVSEDLSTITTIPKNSIDKLFEKEEWCICQNIEEQLGNKDVLTEIHIGIGYLSILLEDNTIKYKFVPTRRLEKNIKETLKTGHNPIEKALEEGLANRIIYAYKDLL